MKKVLLVSSLLISGVSMAQLPVSTAAENRNVVLEEYTGIHCTYCPDGHKLAQQYKDANPGDVILVNIHVGGYAVPNSGEPDFRTPFGSALDAQSDLTGYPAGSINRTVFPAYAMDGGTAMSRGEWDDAGNQILAMPSYVNVAGEAELDVTTGVLTVTIEYHYTGNSPVSTNKLNVALLMNNVEGPQTGAASFYPANILPNGNYNHQHMLRHFLTGQYGADINTTTMGSTGTLVYTYTIPAHLNNVEYNLGNLEVVAYIAEGQQTIITGAEVPLDLVNFPNQKEGNLTFVDDVEGMCSGAGSITPYVAVKNEGEETITSMTLNTTVNGGAVVSTNWVGNIPFGQTEYINLNVVNFTVSSSNTMNVVISSVNGTADEILTNNAMVKNFGEAPIGGNYVKVIVKTDFYPGETEWTITDDGGNVIATDSYEPGTADSFGGGGADANKTFEYNVDLGSAGCFTLEVTDEYGDGMIYNAGGSTTSASAYGVTLKKYTGANMINYVGNWGFDEADKFQSDGAVTGSGLAEEALASGVSIYPNPATDLTNIEFNVTEASDVTVQVTNALGQIVYSNYMGEVNGTQKVVVNTAALETGMYLVQINVNGSVITERVSVVK